jgi:hypothetical protein
MESKENSTMKSNEETTTAATTTTSLPTTTATTTTIRYSLPSMLIEKNVEMRQKKTGR